LISVVTPHETHLAKNSAMLQNCPSLQWAHQSSQTREYTVIKKQNFTLPITLHNIILFLFFYFIYLFIYFIICENSGDPFPSRIILHCVWLWLRFYILQLNELSLPDHWMKYFFTAQAYLELQLNQEALRLYDKLRTSHFACSTYVMSQLALAYHNNRG